MQNRMILRFKPPFLLFSCQVLFKRIAEATGESLESVFKMQEAERNELVEVLGLKREEDQKEESKVENQPPPQVLPVHLRQEGPSLTCELCQKETKTLQSLVTHVIVHFRVELERKVKDLMEFSELEGFQCKLCDKTFKCKTPLIAHIGYKHGKLNDILREKGYSVLPALDTS